MTSRERIFSAWNGERPDHVPLTVWAFGLSAHKSHSWYRQGKKIGHWFSKRMEHLHTIPGDWTLEDDFERTKALLSLGLDDIIDVSVPWGTDPEVSFKDAVIPPSQTERYSLMMREYTTPAGQLIHSGAENRRGTGEGWACSLTMCLF